MTSITDREVTRFLLTIRAYDIADDFSNGDLIASEIQKLRELCREYNEKKQHYHLRSMDEQRRKMASLVRTTLGRDEEGEEHPVEKYHESDSDDDYVPPPKAVAKIVEQRVMARKSADIKRSKEKHRETKCALLAKKVEECALARQQVIAAWIAYDLALRATPTITTTVNLKKRHRNT